MPRGAQVVIPPEPIRKRAFFLAREHGDVADSLEIGIETSDRAGQGEVTVTGNSKSGASGHRVS